MRFDYTKGKSARYLVSLHGWDVVDRYYFHYFKEAKDLFEQVKANQLKEGHKVSIYDLKTDELKAFAIG